MLTSTATCDTSQGQPSLVGIGNLSFLEPIDTAGLQIWLKAGPVFRKGIQTSVY